MLNLPTTGHTNQDSSTKKGISNAGRSLIIRLCLPLLKGLLWHTHLMLSLILIATMQEWNVVNFPGSQIYVNKLTTGTNNPSINSIINIITITTTISWILMAASTLIHSAPHETGNPCVSSRLPATPHPKCPSSLTWATAAGFQQLPASKRIHPQAIFYKIAKMTFLKHKYLTFPDCKMVITVRALCEVG